MDLRWLDVDFSRREFSLVYLETKKHTRYFLPDMPLKAFFSVVLFSNTSFAFIDKWQNKI